MGSMVELPDFVPPMLARIGTPFDSDDHLFEIKWDGIRALTFVEPGGRRMRTRNNHEIAARYPELEGLDRIAPGALIDGEIVVLEDGLPDFQKVLKREQVRDPRRARALAAESPALYMAFDLLYASGEDITGETLENRRARLRELLAALGNPRIVVTEGVTGAGREFFAQAGEQGLEGIVAKRLRSTYQPGRRSGDWQKIKHSVRIHCLVLGFVPSGDDDFKSLIIASDLDGELELVGKVGSGFDDETRARLNQLLRARPRAEPLIPCTFEGCFVEPGLFCVVSYLERTHGGMLRAPVFESLSVDR